MSKHELCENTGTSGLGSVLKAQTCPGLRRWRWESTGERPGDKKSQGQGVLTQESRNGDRMEGKLGKQESTGTERMVSRSSWFRTGSHFTSCLVAARYVHTPRKGWVSVDFEATLFST